MGILKLQEVSKFFGKDSTKVKALNEINLNIDEGEFTAIVGESGSGKSTLISLMGGLDKPTEGEIVYNGISFFSLNALELSKIRKKEISVVYQFYNLIPSLTVKENIILPVLLGKKELDERKLDELLNKLNLKVKASHYADDLSGGQKQKVAIARALINQPTLILADEPTGNLDTESTKEVINLLKKENEENGTTVIIVTHNLEIAKICNRVITLKDGSIINDTKNEVL